MAVSSGLLKCRDNRFEQAEVFIEAELNKKGENHGFAASDLRIICFGSNENNWSSITEIDLPEFKGRLK